MDITRRKTGITDKQIEDIIFAKLNTKVKKIKRLKPGGTINEVFFIEREAKKEELVLKVSLREEARLTGECWPLEECSKRGVPVPKVLASGMIQTKLPYSSQYILNTRILGDPLQRPSHSLKYHLTEASRLREAGYLLSKIHTIKTKNFGCFKTKGEGIFRSWKEFLFGHIFDGNIFSYLIEKGLISDNSEKNIRNLFEAEKAYLELESPVLLHGEFSWRHIFTDKGKISGIIDFGNCISGDPLYDLAAVEFMSEAKGYLSPLPYLLEGYKNGFTKEELERKIVFYKLHKVLRRIRWRIEKGEGIKTMRKVSTLIKQYLQHLG